MYKSLLTKFCNRAFGKAWWPSFLGRRVSLTSVLKTGPAAEPDQPSESGIGPLACSLPGSVLITLRPPPNSGDPGTYLHHKEIKAAQGIKIIAQGLEHAIAGTGLYVVGPDDDLEDVKESVMEDMNNMLSRIDKTGEGVYVQASTLGSLEALLEFLKLNILT